MTGKDTCESCGGLGILLSVSCLDEYIIERCDTCETYPNDSEACRVLFTQHQQMVEALKQCITAEGAHCFNLGTIGVVRRIQAINEIAAKALEVNNATDYSRNPA